jgi:acetyl-CoA C-acetyltransferase
LDWRETDDRPFEDLWPLEPMLSEYETRHGVAYPIRVYCLFEQVLRHELGLSLAAYRNRLGQVFAPFSAVAAANPYAQFPQARTAAEIGMPSAQNFLLSEPYTKWMVAQDAVNQGAAAVLTSVKIAREYGIPESNWIFLRAYADVDDQFIVNRPRLATSCAQGLALSRALDDSGLSLAEIALVDLYSCFPIAVTSACEHLGLDPLGDRALTLTGGLPYFGGPGNNYSLHAIAEVAARLRNARDTHALIAANGGYLSKHSVGVYSARLDGAWQPRSSARERAQAKAPSGIEVAEMANGAATIESYTADYHKDAPAGGYIVGRLADKRRFLAMPEPGDAAAQARLFMPNPIGTPIAVTHRDGVNFFAAR